MQRIILAIGAVLIAASPCLLAAMLWWIGMMEEFPIPGPEPKPDMSASWIDYAIAYAAAILVASLGLAAIGSQT